MTSVQEESKISHGLDYDKQKIEPRAGPVLPSASELNASWDWSVSTEQSQDEEPRANRHQWYKSTADTLVQFRNEANCQKRARPGSPIGSYRRTDWTSAAPRSRRSARLPAGTRALLRCSDSRSITRPKQ